MYTNYWGLRQSPFANTGIRSYRSESQEEAIARIQYLMEGNRRLGLLVGPDGVGKTSVLEWVAAKQRRIGMPFAMINVLGMDGSEFILSVCESLGIRIDKTPTAVSAWRGIYDQFLTNQYQSLRTILLIDDIHEAEQDVLTAITRLAQWQPARTSRVTIIAASEADRVELVGRRLLELSDLRMDLAPWRVEDTVALIHREMEAAGCDRVVFGQETLEEIHRVSEGIPRRIGQLTELALVAGAGQKMDQIDSETILAVQEELRIRVTPAA